MPCWKPLTPQQHDETLLAALIAAVEVSVDSSDSVSILSKVMQEFLRMYSLFNFKVSSSDPLDVTVFVAFVCNKLQQMKEDANHDVSPALVAAGRC